MSVRSDGHVHFIFRKVPKRPSVFFFATKYFYVVEIELVDRVAFGEVRLRIVFVETIGVFEHGRVFFQHIIRIVERYTARMSSAPAFIVIYATARHAQ